MRSNDFFTDLEAQLMSAHERRAARRLPNLPRPMLAVGVALVAAAIAIAALLVALSGGDTPNPTSDRGAPASSRQSTFSPPPVPDHGEGIPVPERQRGSAVPAAPPCAGPDSLSRRDSVLDCATEGGSAPGEVRATPPRPAPPRTKPRRSRRTSAAPAPRPGSAPAARVPRSAPVPIISEGGGSDGPVPARPPSEAAPRVPPPTLAPTSPGAEPPVVSSAGGGED